MKGLRIWRLFVSVVAVISLLLNVVVIAGLLEIRGGLDRALTAARDALARQANQPIAFTVAIDQPIPIQADIPIDETFTIPIDFVYPLDTVINTHIDIPVLGRQEIAVPVETRIPISHTLEIPVEMTVPVSVTYHLQTDIPVEVAVPPDLLTTLDALLQGLTSELDPLPK